MFGLSANTQQIVGYSLFGLGAALGGYTFYKFVKKKKAGGTARLNGVGYRRKKRNSTKKKTSKNTTVKKINLK